MIEPLSLEQAHQLIHKLRTQQADLEFENERLKRELEALRTINPEEPSYELESLGGTTIQDQTEKKVAPNKGLLRCILDSVGDLIYVKDLAGVYRACNKASERFIGLPESEQIGKTDFDLFDRDKAEEVRNIDRRIITTGQEYCVEEWVSSPKGKRVLLESKKAPFSGPDGEVAGIVGISRDITDRKMAEEALKKTNQDLDAFVYTVSHDLNTPLTAIIGFAEILQERHKNDLDQQDLLPLEEILSSADKMQAMMEDLLSLATVGQIDRQAAALDVGDVAREVVGDLDAHLSLAGVSVDIGDLPSLVISKTLLVQILDNLIGNALKYGCESGDVIEIGYEGRGEKKVFYVRDHGSGIPTDEGERIFKPFFRGSNGKDKQGSGIGLATVRKIAKVCGGDAWVEETPGGGATFCVELNGGKLL